MAASAAFTSSVPALFSALPGNALAALFAAAAWGGGDFSGGMGVKSVRGTARGALRFILLAHGLSLALLVGVLAFIHASAPHGAALWWGLGGGVAAGISITAFYMALARGTMGTSAALSGVIAAAIPAVVSRLIEGAPHPLAFAGFAAAAVAIWFIAAPPSGAAPENRTTTGLALLGGLGFGIYFTALRFANPLGVFEPIALARLGSLFTCAALLLVVPSERGEQTSVFRKQPFYWVCGVAVLDTAGNLLFTWSTRLGRLDAAAVLASLYPASTILLAAWLLHERPTRRQWLGMGLALMAVVLITL